MGPTSSHDDHFVAIMYLDQREIEGLQTEPISNQTAYQFAGKSVWPLGVSKSFQKPLSRIGVDASGLSRCR